MFIIGLGGFSLTLLLVYYLPANLVRSAAATGAVTVGSLATQVPKKKTVLVYLFKQLFYWKSWSGRFNNARVLASNATSSVKEIGFWRTTGRGIRYLGVAGWTTLKGFIKSLLILSRVSSIPHQGHEYSPPLS